jgi:hypothetical protein
MHNQDIEFLYCKELVNVQVKCGKCKFKLKFKLRLS